MPYRIPCSQWLKGFSELPMRRWQSLPRRGGVKSIAIMWHVYVLRSLKDHGYYIGCTTDIKRRLSEHNAGQTLSIAKRTPFEVVYTETYTNQSDAYVREKVLKSYKGGNGLKVLLG